MTQPDVRAILVLTAFGVAFAFGSEGCNCDAEDDFGPINVDPVAPVLVERAAAIPASDVAASAAAGNALAFDLLAQTAKGKNVLISPHSIRMALSMAAGGARGQTLEVMRTALRTSLKEPARHAALFALDVRIRDAAARGEDPIELRVANSLWLENGFVVEADYKQLMERWYAAPPVQISLVNELHRIDAWASEKTKGLIPKVMPEAGLPEEVLLVLVNAVYFKARWMHEFDPSSTSPRLFHRVGAAPIDAQHMFLKSHLRYARHGGWAAVELPYRGGAESMIVLVADGEPTHELPDLATFDALVTGMKRANVEVYLPRFRFKFSTSLAEPLKALGMEIAFSSGANFRGISDKELKISDVLHSTFVDVSEQGTEAAAVTAVSVSPSKSAAPEPPIQIVFDRPFVSAIRDNASGALLFVGQVTDAALAQAD